MDITPLFGISLLTQSILLPVLVYWSTPPVRSCRVNTDGCVKDGFASGGKIIRDSLGQCVRAFFSSYCECPILKAELRAILDSIILARRIAAVRHIRHLIAFDRNTISHIYREGNQVVDLLASKGWNRRCYFEYSIQDILRQYRSLVQIDKHGLPIVRGL
ncbi:Uncharacterized protein Adt_22105 [Abeliophyllum distichum]|uniref:RNase H type-1 domain-containing protein n=1 Tax=Abeliophyllum distichum TaxID=126358 RepID=A0ABD1T198_9LAMI